jgi:type I restriction-modification system DNA methylase subunit
MVRVRQSQRLRAFHDWLRSLRFLDPACGSGNFSYVTRHAVKRIEVEVLSELADVTGSRELRFQEVDRASSTASR